MLIDLQLKGELIYRKTANINVKKLQFIHVLTAQAFAHRKQQK